MTQIQRAINYINTLEKGTVLYKQDYTHAGFEYRKTHKGEYFTDWCVILANPERFGVERREETYRTPTTKITTVDVLEMVKRGCTAEEIEEAIYTTQTVISIVVK